MHWKEAENWLDNLDPQYKKKKKKEEEERRNCDCCVLVTWLLFLCHALRSSFGLPLVTPFFQHCSSCEILDNYYFGCTGT